MYLFVKASDSVNSALSYISNMERERHEIREYSLADPVYHMGWCKYLLPDSSAHNSACSQCIHPAPGAATSL